MERAEKESPRPGTRGAAQERSFSTEKSSTAHLVLALRTHSWSTPELIERDRRRRRAELRRRHLEAAIAAWRADMPACRYHAKRMAEARGVRRV